MFFILKMPGIYIPEYIGLSKLLLTAVIWMSLDKGLGSLNCAFLFFFCMTTTIIKITATIAMPATANTATAAAIIAVLFAGAAGLGIVDELERMVWENTAAKDKFRIIFMW